MTTPSEVITALEKALEAGPTQGEWHVEPQEDGVWEICTERRGAWIMRLSSTVIATKQERAEDLANAKLMAACNPLAIRTLLDAHASALRDAAKLREALRTLLPMFEAWHEEFPDDVGHKEGPALEAARSALDDNTKGAAE